MSTNFAQQDRREASAAEEFRRIACGGDPARGFDLEQDIEPRELDAALEAALAEVGVYKGAPRNLYVVRDNTPKQAI